MCIANTSQVPVALPRHDEVLLASARKTGHVFTVEEHSVVGGLGSLCAEAIARGGLSVRMGQVALARTHLAARNFGFAESAAKAAHAELPGAPNMKN